MKKLLIECWLTNETGTRLSRLNIMRITQRMTNLQCQIPREFQRAATQSLGLIKKWKATEYRFFLLYCGPFVLKDILPVDQYEHFLYLFVAMRILCCKSLIKKFVSHAQIYLERFVLQSAILYKLEFLSSNIHSLIHLVQDAIFFNCTLSQITTFSFESLLGRIKKRLRSGRMPLKQLCNRLHEEWSIPNEKATIPPKLKVLKIKKNTKKSSEKVIQSLEYNGFFLSNKNPDNCLFLKNKNFLLISKMCYVKNEIKIFGKTFSKLSSAFDHPTSSSDLNIYKSSGNFDETISISLNDIECKALHLSIYELDDDQKDQYLIPMLHS